MKPTRAVRVDASIALGLVGSITGVSGLVLAWQSQREENEVLLAAYASAGRDDLTAEGFGLRMEVVNASLRPVIVRSADLVLDGEVVAHASAYLDDPKVLDSARANPTLISDRSRPFPIGLGARSGRSLVVVMDVWRPVARAETPALEQAARKQLVRLLTVVGALREGHEQFTRPVIGQQSTLFPLPPLARGAYMATFLLDGDVVAYASFAVPFRTRVAR